MKNLALITATIAIFLSACSVEPLSEEETIRYNKIVAENSIAGCEKNNAISCKNLLGLASQPESAPTLLKMLPNFSQKDILAKTRKLYRHECYTLKKPNSCAHLWQTSKYGPMSEDELHDIAMKEVSYYVADCDVNSRKNKSCEGAALAYIVHVKTKQGVQSALDIREARCANDFTHDCKRLVSMYGSSKYGVKDKAKADKYRQKLCALGQRKYCA